jgi:hypothetical protein
MNVVLPPRAAKCCIRRRRVSSIRNLLSGIGMPPLGISRARQLVQRDHPVSHSVDGVMIDNRGSWKPDRTKSGRIGGRVKLMFDVRKILQPRRCQRRNSRNPSSAGLTLHLRKVNLRIFACFQLEQPSRCPIQSGKPLTASAALRAKNSRPRRNAPRPG